MDSDFSKTQEFYDLMSTFEHTHKHLRLDREKRGDTPAGYWYQSGETNDIFKEYLEGYMTGRSVYLGHKDEVEAELIRLRAVNAELRKILARALAEEKCGADGVFFTVATECTEGRCWHFQARAALSRAAQAAPETCVDVEKIDTAIAEALGEAYDCTRVWESWGYGAMRSDDFVRVSDDPGRIMEIRDAMLKAMGTPEQEAKPETCVWKYEEAWVSGCGLQYINAVIDADMKFCPFCGKKVEVKG